jgi:MFS family permease
MEQASKKLWNRDFSLLIAGQIMSIFGNMILSWALPFYVLDISGSAALFGLVIGLPYISLLVMSPIGGIMADRLRKQRIMFWLDLTTTVIIVLYMAASGLFTAVVPLVIVKLLALNAIQGMYMPAVQSAVPALVSTEKLVPANAAVTVINSLSNILAPAAAGILYSGFGLFPILAISAVCFAITAIMDLLIRIPYKKQNSSGSITQMIKSDMSQAFEFAVKEQPILTKCAVLIFLFTITLVSLLLVGLPVLITQNLDMSMDMVGISSSIMMVGGLLGGITAGVLGRRLPIR